MIEKCAIISLNYIINNDELYTLLREICVHSIMKYAKRMSVDFILMNNNNNEYQGTSNQLQCIDYLFYYDKILYVDGDCYIPKNFNTHILNKIDNNVIGTTISRDSPFIVEDNCYLKYRFVIFCIHKNMSHWFSTDKNNLIDLYEEIYINKIIQSNNLNIKNLPYIHDIKYVPTRISNNTIYHFICNNKKRTHFYRNLIIKNIKKLKI